MNGPASVRVRNLTRRFGSFTAVDGISFDIRPGEIWGFLGPNGSGKSTTIRMLCGVIAPSSGSAYVLGHDVARDPEAVKLRSGYMSQGASLWRDLTVDEHLRFYAGLFGMRKQRAHDAIEQWVRRTGLSERRKQLAGELPGGFQKRLALACTLLHDPQMLFLDEPTSGVDPVSRREFWDVITGLADAGSTVMVTTHYLDEAEHCSTLALIYGGKIVASGTPDSLKHARGFGTTLEIRSPRNAELLERIESLPYVRSAALYGSALHAVVGPGEDARTLRAWLAGEQIPEAGVAEVTPSLEDVFATVVEAL